MVGAVIWLSVVVLLIVAWRRLRRARRSGIGAAASGTIYDFLNQDKRNAVEMIVEERAGARDPEDRDGNLPDLEKPRP